MHSPPCIFCDSPTRIDTQRIGFTYSSRVTCMFTGCASRGPTVRGETTEQAEAIAVKAYKTFEQLKAEVEAALENATRIEQEYRDA